MRETVASLPIPRSRGKGPGDAGRVLAAVRSDTAMDFGALQEGGDVIHYMSLVKLAGWAAGNVSHHGGELDSTLVAEAARQAVAPRHVKLAST